MIYLLIALLTSISLNIYLYREITRIKKIVHSHSDALTTHVQDTDATEDENTAV